MRIESDRGGELYNSTFQNFFKSKNIQHYSRFTDKDPSVAERVFRTIRIFLQKPVFEKGNANWLSELPFAIKRYKNAIHNSTKLAPIHPSRKSNEKEVYSNLQDRTDRQQPNFKLGQLNLTAGIERVFSKGDSTNWSYISYTKNQILFDTIPSFRINYLPEKYNENPLKSTNITLDENNQVMKKLNLIQ